MHRTKTPTMKVILFRRLKKAVEMGVSIQVEKIEANNSPMFDYAISYNQGKVKGILAVAYDMEDHYKGLGERLEHISFYLTHRAWRGYKKQK